MNDAAVDDSQWYALAEALTQLSDTAAARLNVSQDALEKIDQVSVDLLRGALPDAHTVTLVRLNDEGGRTGRISGVSSRVGKAQEEWLGRPIDLDDVACTSFDAVLNDKAPQVVDAAAIKHELWAGTGQTVVSAVSRGRSHPASYGLLTIYRPTTGMVSPGKFVTLAAERFAHEVGFYTALHEAQLAVVTQREEQIKVFEDLKHRLASPLKVAFTLLQDDAPDLGRVVGAVRTSFDTARSLGLFLQLEKNQPLQPAARPFTGNQLAGLVVAAARDYEAIAPVEVKFDVDQVTFGKWGGDRVLVDVELFNLALGALLENAGKYSRPGSTVRIVADAPERHDNRAVRVTNTGMVLRPEEVPLCTERSWRSKEAKGMAGQGSGIGLWLARKVMESTNGRLEVQATTPRGTTTFRLVLPTVRRD